MTVVINNYFFLTKKRFKKSIYKKNDSSGKRSDPGNFSKVSIYNFLDLKRYKKGCIEMTEKIYLEIFEKCPGSLRFPLLMWSFIFLKVNIFENLLIFEYFILEIYSKYNL